MPVKHQFRICSVSVPYPFRIRSASVPYPFRIRSVSVPYPFRIRSVSVPYLFRIRSVSVPYPFPYILLSGSYRTTPTQRKSVPQKNMTGAMLAHGLGFQPRRSPCLPAGGWGSAGRQAGCRADQCAASTGGHRAASAGRRGRTPPHSRAPPCRTRPPGPGTTARLGSRVVTYSVSRGQGSKIR